MPLPVALGYWIFGLGVLGLLTAFLWVFALVDLVGKRSDLDRRQRWAWLLVIVLLPIVGSIWYLVRRPVLEDEREKALNAAARRSDRLSR
jgi:amino acid transporter